MLCLVVQVLLTITEAPLPWIWVSAVAGAPVEAWSTGALIVIGPPGARVPPGGFRLPGPAVVAPLLQVTEPGPLIEPLAPEIVPAACVKTPSMVSVLPA